MSNELVMKMRLTDSVQYVKGVGPRRAVQFKKLGIETVGDLLYHFPRRYEDRRTSLAAVARHGDTVCLEGTVVAGQELKPRRGLTITKLAVCDGTTTFYTVWFNQPYILRQLRPGARIAVAGKVDRSFGRVEIHVTEWEPAGGQTLSTGRIVPVYAGTEKLPQKVIRGAVQAALEVANEVREFLPPAVLHRQNLVELARALRQVHFPASLAEAEAARRRFIFEELFLLQVALARRRAMTHRATKPFRYGPDGPLVAALRESLPFRLTAAQERAWRQVAEDMQRPEPMQRLLQGDVGCGKTVVAVMALVKAQEGGLQGALMAPTEILAEQHYLKLQDILAPLGLKPYLLTGSLDQETRRANLEAIATGVAGIVVGTHALIQDEVKFARLGLVIIDEQHRFGVRQRAMLQDKGVTTDLLVMTATPIPRTLALTLYGDLDISIIDEMPPGRQPVQTFYVAPEGLERLYERIREEVARGYQVYVVCPLIEESEQLQSHAATELAAHLAERVFTSCRVGLLHGRMRPDAREEVMDAFRRGQIDILVTTTVIEVGVDVPNATGMVILDAERFGLAQLHQLRGRVGRGRARSWCALVGAPRTAEAKARLRALVATNDGFQLAEEDLRLRGPGEFFGVRQSGVPEFKIADPVRDVQILEAAREEARRVVEADPDLRHSENAPLRAAIEARFGFTATRLGIS
ncbi:MAG: RecG-like helicase [Clostridia bacterium 62_21]|nr:MAG: RecG-like helicase [Clostridia bacterium 62_21]